MSAPSLLEIQKYLQRIFTDPQGAIDAIYESGTGGPSLIKFIVDAPPMGFDERIDIYAEGYLSRLVSSLASDFARVREVLGDKYFRVLVSDYLAVFPSRYASLSDVGKNLSLFIPEHMAAEEFPFLAEVARFEWMKNECYHAENRPPLDVSKLGHVSREQWEGARFALDPAVRLLDLTWTVHQKDITAKKNWQLLHRRDFKVVGQAIDESTFEVLQRIRQGATLLELTSAAGALDLGALFNSWIGAGIISEIQIPSLTQS